MNSFMMKWYNFEDLDSKEIEDLTLKTYKVLREKSLHTPEEIITLAYYIYLNIEKLTLRVNYINAKFIKYIDEINKTQKFKESISNFSLYQRQIAVINQIQKKFETDIFSKITQHLNKTISKTYHSIIFDKLLNQIKNNPTLFSNWFDEEFMDNTYDFPVGNPNHLWNNLINLSPTDFKNIMNCFHKHVKDIPNADMKDEEIMFWENFCHLAKKQSDEWEQNNMEETKRLTINEYIGKTKVKLDAYRKHENVKKMPIPK